MSRVSLSRPDPELLAWCQNFAARTTATPQAYGLTVEQAADFAAMTAGFAARLASTIDPATRSRGGLSAKTQIRAHLKAQIKALTRPIDANPNTTPAQRAELGIPTHVPNNPWKLAA